MSDRDAAREKIEKLMAMANDGRGNEFEAEAALRQAEKLMRKHGIGAAELQERTGTKPIYSWGAILVPAGAPKPISTTVSWFGTIGVGIAKFTDTIVRWERHPLHGMCLSFKGDAFDVEFAVWLAKHLRDDARRQSAAFLGSRAEKEDFRVAYASRVQARMVEAVAERRRAYASAGTALVVVNTKIAMRDEHFGGGNRFSRGKGRRMGSYAQEAGRAAGDRAGINRPISGAGSGVRAIGGG